MNGIRIDDLAAPRFSVEAKRVLEDRARFSKTIPFTLVAICALTEQQLDVPFFRDGLMLESVDRFIHDLDRTGTLNPAGKCHFIKRFSEAFVQRSRLEDLYLRHPEIDEISFAAPIIVAGPPRSGTTHMSNMLGSDSRLNALSVWEGFRPFPSRAVLDGHAADDRQEAGAKWMGELRAMLPYLPNMVDITADDTVEDTALLDLAGFPFMELAMVDTPAWRRWVWSELDPTPMFVLQKRALKALQWLRSSTNRWIMNSPHFLAFMPAMDEVYEDATWVITHRDPASLLVSNATMLAYMFRAHYDRPDVQAALELDRDMAEAILGGVTRDAGLLDPARVEHVYFHEYMADQVGTVRRVYDRAKLEWTAQTEENLKAYIAQHARGRHGGRLQYDPEGDFGVSREALRSECAYYLDKFPRISIEVEHG